MEKEENNQLAFFDGPLKRGYLLDDWRGGASILPYYISHCYCYCWNIPVRYSLFTC
jgi:hypothetical protein